MVRSTRHKPISREKARARVVVRDEGHYEKAKAVLALTNERVIADVPDYFVLSVENISERAVDTLRHCGISVVDEPEYAID